MILALSWRYTRHSRQWVWRRGHASDDGLLHGQRGVTSSTSHPGFRRYMTTVVDEEGVAWMIAGIRISGRPAGDIWSYDSHNNAFTWRAGTIGINIDPDYSHGKGVHSDAGGD